MTREARIQEAIQQTTELQEWLLRAGVVAKQLNVESSRERGGGNVPASDK